MIKISKELKNKFKDIKYHLIQLKDPLKIASKFDDIHVIKDKNNQVIPGTLRYGKDNQGPVVAILGGIHMNEMAGVYSLASFHNRWIQGRRPEQGVMLTAVGHIDRAIEFIDVVLQTEKISPQAWASFGQTRDFFNFNRIPWNILSHEMTLSPNLQRAYDIIKNVILPAKGRVLDIHNTSIAAPPMITLFMNQNETPERSVARLVATGVTKSLPIETVIIWKPGPYNGMESIRMFGTMDSGAIPILIEAGTAYDHHSFENADQFTQTWLTNVLPSISETTPACSGNADINRRHYIETAALYHPNIRPNDYAYLDKEMLSQVKQDTFILIRDWSSLNNIKGWSKTSEKCLEKLKTQSLLKERLDNFMPIKKGDIIAIGLETSLEISAPQDGYVLMVGPNPYVRPTFNETFANLGIQLP